MRPRWITWVLSAAAVVALTGCPFPEAECDGSKTIADRQCRGTELWRCNTAGFYAPIEYCGEAGSACVETTSAPGGAKCGESVGNNAMVPAECTPNKDFCVGDNVVQCSVTGEPTTVRRRCGDNGQTCGVEAGVATCVAAPANNTTPNMTANNTTANNSSAQPTSCPTRDEDFCFEGVLWGCDTLRQPTMAKQDCAAENKSCIDLDRESVCASTGGAEVPATCVKPFCLGDAVIGCDASQSATEVLEDCADAGQTCGENEATGRAECVDQ